jgi:hypothetical protein
MSILNSGIVPVGSTGYDIDNSLRLNDDDTAYLSRTPGAGNQQTFTYSCWIKKGNIDQYGYLLAAGTSNRFYIAFQPDDTLTLMTYQGTTPKYKTTSARYRDISAWYHIVAVVDTTNATAEDRQRIYVNGERITDWASNVIITQNTNVANINTATPHYISGRYDNTRLFDGYLAEVNFVDGQALTPADFGETDETYGHWKLKAYEGTYGTNGFYLDFKNSGSLGNDANGSNNWTPNNLAATDQMLDSPTNNFATLNPLQINSSITYSEGNLKAYRSSGDHAQSFGSIQVTSGKWYAEFCGTAQTTLRCQIGVQINDKVSSANRALGQDGYSYRAYNGNKSDNGTESSYASTYTDGDIISVVLDADNGDVTFYKNGASLGQAFSSISADSFKIGTSGEDGWAIVANFGQDSSFAGNKTSQGNADGNGYGDFYYTPPTGYLALCTQNLPEPAVVPSEHFDIKTYTGTGGSHTVTFDSLTNLDLLWVKKRNAVASNALQDRVRGDAYYLYSDTTNVEMDWSGYTPTFNTAGFGLANDPGIWNDNGGTYVAWGWKANGAGVSNTNGTITSTVSANVDAGFSIVSWVANGTAGSTIGHGLTVVPEMMIVKSRDQAGTQWIVYYGDNTDYLRLQGTNATTDDINAWNDTSPTSSVFSVGGNGGDTNNTSGGDMIGYMFHSVEGYSKVGSYTGNGSTDGTFVHCGFRPAYVMVKPTSRTGRWRIKDAVRDVDNVMDKRLAAEGSDAEATGTTEYLDFTSNGFKIRTAEGQWNGNGETNIFIAFAEHPFKYTNAR